MWLFIAGGALTVTVTFVIVAAFARSRAERYAALQWSLQGSLVERLARGRWLAAFARAIGVAGLLLVVLAGIAGTQNPHTSIVPTLVWILWWVGFIYVAMLVGNLWPVLNPWRTLYDLFPGKRGKREAAREKFPEQCAGWIALAALLVFGWIELIFPYRATPAVLAGLALAYSAITWWGMARYGPEAWLENADPFHRLFELLSRFAPCALRADGALLLRPYAAGLVSLSRERRGVSTAETGFIIAMLAIVLFDGFQASKHWSALEDLVHALHPDLGDAGWVALHTAGLLAMWLAFVGLYLGACAVAHRFAGGGGTVLGYARAFAPALVPIAVGYQFAHTFVYLIMQGQNIVSLVSDPLGLGWNLFGTRDIAPDPALISAKTAWTLALAAIVTGHAISVLLADIAAGRLLGSGPRALRALLPMTLLMVLYTIISLQILAEPLVRYSGPQETII